MTQKDENMNMTQVRVILQYAVTYGMAWIVAKGYLPQDVATEVGAAIVAVIPAIYSTWKSRDAGKVATAANVEGVTVVAPPAITNALSPHASVLTSTENKVVSRDDPNGGSR